MQPGTRYHRYMYVYVGIQVWYGATTYYMYLLYIHVSSRNYNVGTVHAKLLIHIYIL